MSKTLFATVLLVFTMIAIGLPAQAGPARLTKASVQKFVKKGKKKPAHGKKKKKKKHTT